MPSYRRTTSRISSSVKRALGLLPQTVLQQQGLGRLPASLFDLIVHHTSSRTDILTCALVCRSWMTASRRHLPLNLFSQAQARKLAGLLESPYQTLSNHSREIILWGELQTLNNDLTGFISAMESLSNRQAPIRRATVVVDPRSLRLLSQTFPRLRHLTVVALEPDMANSFVTHLPQFQHLHSLNLLMNGDAPKSMNMKDLMKMAEVRIPELRLDGWNTSLYAYLILRCTGVRKLVIRDVGGTQAGDMQRSMMQDIVRRNKSTLTTVEVGVAYLDTLWLPLEILPYLTEYEYALPPWKERDMALLYGTNISPLCRFRTPRLDMQNGVERWTKVKGKS